MPTAPGVGELEEPAAADQCADAAHPFAQLFRAGLVSIAAPLLAGCGRRDWAGLVPVKERADLIVATACFPTLITPPSCDSGTG